MTLYGVSVPSSPVPGSISVHLPELPSFQSRYLLLFLRVSWMAEPSREMVRELIWVGGDEWAVGSSVYASVRAALFAAEVPWWLHARAAAAVADPERELLLLQVMDS